MSRRALGRSNQGQPAETKGVLLLNPHSSSRIPGGYNDRADQQQSPAYRILGDLRQPQGQASFFYGQNPNQMRHLSPYEMINTTDENNNNRSSNKQLSMKQSNRNLTPRRNGNNITTANTTTSGYYSPSPLNSASSKSPTNGQRQQSLNKLSSRPNIIPIVPPPGTQIVLLPNGKYVAQRMTQPQQTASFRNPQRTPSVSILGEQRQDYQPRGRSPSRLIQLTQPQQYPLQPQPQQYQQRLRTPSSTNMNTNLTPPRSRIRLDMNPVMPPYQQARLNQVLRRSEEEVQDLVEDTIYEEANKLKKEIDFLTTQLRAKDQEVAVYSSYIKDLRNNLLTNPQGLPLQPQQQQLQQSQIYQVPQVQSIFQHQPQIPPYLAQSSSPIGQRYQKQQQYYSPYEVDLGDDLGRREFQDQQRQNQQQLDVISNLEKNYGVLKRQLQERDYLVAQQQEEIIQYQGKYLKNRRSESESAERVRRLEHENGMCQIKINSLEQNLQLMEQEYRLLKETQQISSRYPSYA